MATPVESLDISKQQVVDQISITRLEEEIDAMNQTLPPLANFILPGGHRCISQMHMSRSICRRSERAVCELSNNEEIRTEPQIYLNRLSDWLFVAARKIATDLDVKEVLWRQRRKEL
ncbi:MAG: ATP:cob(I)alamin adenosyltransferase [Bdellovibrionota bacterium]